MLPLSFVGTPIEMTKRRWKELMQGLYESHFDPSKDEELKQSKIGIESKLPKIIKLVKERRQKGRNKNVEANLRKEAELIDLIEDIHKQYQFVYGRYDDLRGQLSKTVNGVKEDEGYFTATSSSDSETESENDVRTDDHTHLNHEKKPFKKSEYEKAMNKVHANENSMQELKEKLNQKEREISSLVRVQKLCQKEVSGLMKEIELELSSFNTKLDAIMSSENKASVVQQVENKKLQDQILKFEERAKEIDEEISQLVNNGVDGVTEKDGLVYEVSKMKGLIIQVTHLQKNVDCLIHAQKNDSEKQKALLSNNNGFAMHENLLNQVNKMKHDLESMKKKNTDLESNFKKKARENLEVLSQIADLKKEVAKKAQEIQKMKKEKEDSLVRVKNLELEAHNLAIHQSEREKLIARKEQEKIQLTQEIEVLQGKIVKMDKMLKESEDQMITLQKRLENEEDDKSAQTMASMATINHIEQQLELKNEPEIQIKNNDISKLTNDEKESLQGRISELEKKLEDKESEFSNLQNDMSTQILALTEEVSHLQQEKDMKMKLGEQISSCDRQISELGDEKESLQAKILKLEITFREKEDQIAELQRNSQVGENEVSCLQEELSVERKKFSDQNIMLKQQEDTINKLREDCKLVKGRFHQAAERKMNEVAEEFRKNFEDKLRLLSQRIRVAEQLHVENKESFKNMQEQCQQQHPGLKKRLAQVMSSGKSELQIVSQAVDEMMKGMDCLVSNFESKEKSFLQSLSRASNEIQVAKNWVRWTINEIKPWKNNEPQGSPFALTMDDKEQDKLMKEKVKRLEVKVNKEKNDKLRLIRGMYEMQKKVADLEKTVIEKDEGLLRLGNEKIEAIKQLCMWVDYRQNRFDDHLKEVMMMTKKTKCLGKA